MGVQLTKKLSVLVILESFLNSLELKIHMAEVPKNALNHYAAGG